MAFLSILGAIAGPVLGGLFGLAGKKSEQKEQARLDAAAAAAPAVAQGIDYVKMRKDAEAAGLNFFSAVSAGGAGGYQRVKAQAKIAPMSSLSFLGQTIGGVVSAGFNAFNNFDPNKAKKDALGMQLVQAQINNLTGRKGRQSGSNSSGFARVPVAAGFSSAFGGSSAKMPLLAKNYGDSILTRDGGRWNPNSMWTAPDIGKSSVTNPGLNVLAGRYYVDPKRIDASAGEERAGEPGEFLAGIQTIADDLSYTLKMQSRIGGGVIKVLKDLTIQRFEQPVNDWTMRAFGTGRKSSAPARPVWP